MDAVPTLRPPPPRGPAINESLILKGFVQAMETHSAPLKSLETIALDFGIQRRSLYDFISICSVFGICQRTTGNTLEWFGLHRASPAVDAIRAEVDAQGDNLTLHQLFNYAAEPSLPRIATAVVKLFFFLSVKFLDLRKVGKLFAQGQTKYKTMVRKLYTVASGLEHAGIVKKTTVVSEIQLNLPLKSPLPGNQLGLSYVLNSQTELHEQQRYERRRTEFEEFCGGAPARVVGQTPPRASRSPGSFFDPVVP
jgi:hypothetical protein